MFYHIRMGVIGITSTFEINLTKDDALLKYICPFISKEITFFHGAIINMSSYGIMHVFESERPIDSDWPINKIEIKEKESIGTWQYKYEDKLYEKLEKNDITEILFREAITLIEHGNYQNYRDSILAGLKSQTVFMICPYGNEEVDHNYEFVIKPAVEKKGLKIERADQISHTQTITDKILESLNRSLFVIADLTEAKQNCYYEVGYAHSLGKPVIILAKEGTTRHFDISTYKWNFWKDYKDLKPKLENEIESVILETSGRH